MATGYLRYPHVHGDLITFVAGDDVWLVAAAGGRAWRLSADGTQVSHPRFSRDGTQIAWTSWRDGNPEVYASDTAGGDAARLTFWGDPQTRVTGWTAGGDVLVISAAGQQAMKYRRAFTVPGSGDAPPRLLPFGPVNDLSMEPVATALLTGSVAAEPAYWKRYRGGRAGSCGWPLPRIRCSPGSWPTLMASWPARCWSAAGCFSWPITRVRATSTPVRWTARASRGIPIMTACTPGTRRPMGTGSCITWPGTSGCWTARTRPRRVA